MSDHARMNRPRDYLTRLTPEDRALAWELFDGWYDAAYEAPTSLSAPFDMDEFKAKLAEMERRVTEAFGPRPDEAGRQ